MEFSIPERIKTVHEKMTVFIAEEVMPVEAEFYSEINVGDRWEYTSRQTEIMEGLKDKAKEQNLWNFFMASNPDLGGVSNFEYAHLAELTGHSSLAPEIFNCSSPDSGNMEVLELFGNDEQKAQWLEPLLDGRIRSAFAMTEPQVASSDATNIRCEAKLENGEWLINGEKHYITGVADPRCEIIIAMVVTEPESVGRHKRQSQILIPKNTPGVELVRPMLVFGQDDAPRGRIHLRFHDVRVPEKNIILGRGRGFEISQGRLGPGRIHHCMRAIGAAEYALELMCKRAQSRVAFGRKISELGGNRERIADSRIEINMARLLTMQAAHLMDTIGNKAARSAISEAKVAVPNIALKVIDRAIQMHGAVGMSQDFPLAQMWILQRAMRFIDGPDEVHRAVISRKELAKYAD